MRGLGALTAKAEATPRGDRRVNPAQPMTTLTHPAAAVVAVRTDGYRINQVTVTCPYCSGRHVHLWYGESDGLRVPTCGALVSNRITVDTRVRIDAMRTEFPTPDGVVGLVPLHIGYAYERDGDDDFLGVVIDTAIGKFAMWLQLPAAVQMAAQVVALAEDREQLRERYAKHHV